MSLCECPMLETGNKQVAAISIVSNEQRAVIDTRTSAIKNLKASSATKCVYETALENPVNGPQHDCKHCQICARTMAVTVTPYTASRFSEDGATAAV